MNMLQQSLTSHTSDVLGVLGLLVPSILAIVFYLRGRRERRPCACLRGSSLIAGDVSNVDELTVLFDHRRISSLSVVRVLFYNNGRETIRSSDVATADPLRIQFPPDVTVLKATVVASNNGSSSYTRVEWSRNCVYIDFDYFDYKQGCVIECLHDGPHPHGGRLRGAVMGAARTRHMSIDRTPLPIWHQVGRWVAWRTVTRGRHEPRAYLAVGVTILLLLTMVTMISLLSAVIVIAGSPGDASAAVQPAAASIVSVVMLIGSWTPTRLRRVPHGLELFLEDQFVPADLDDYEVRESLGDNGLI